MFLAEEEREFVELEWKFLSCERPSHEAIKFGKAIFVESRVELWDSRGEVEWERVLPKGLWLDPKRESWQSVMLANFQVFFWHPKGLIAGRTLN